MENKTKKKDFVFDMETQDPDDLLCLLLLAGHPLVNLKAVTVTPGTPHQIGVVRHFLKLLKIDIPVGAFNLDHKKARGTKDEHYVTCVSQWHYNAYNNKEEFEPSRDAEEGWKVLYENLGTNTTLVTGGPKKNLGALLRNWEAENDRMGIMRLNGPSFGSWYAQGGFAGEGVIPPENQLEKFKGRETVPTFNLNGDPKSAQLAIDSTFFSTKRFVGKHICHGVYYDAAMQDAVMHAVHYLPEGRHKDSLMLIVKGMAYYLSRKPKGKKFHDPLAACCAIDPSIGTWANVDLYREKGQWGSRLNPDSDVEIILTYDHDKFVEVLTGSGHGHDEALAKMAEERQ